MSIHDEQLKYERWWLGKRCRIHGYGEFHTVTKVKLVGPPSFVYGCVYLSFDDGAEDIPVASGGFKPTKADVEVEPIKENEGQPHGKIRSKSQKKSG